MSNASFVAELSCFADSCAARRLLLALVMKIVHLHVRHEGRTTTLVFSRLPIRIGRDAPCECRLAFPFVSRAHASLGLHGGRLVLRDVGSTGGTYVRNGAVRVVTGESTDLEDVDWEFQIGRLSIRASLLDDGARTPVPEMQAVDASTDDDPNGTNRTRTFQREERSAQGHDDPEPDSDAVRAEVDDLLARYRGARTELESFVRETASHPETPGRHEAQEALRAARAVLPDSDHDTPLPLPSLSIAPQHEAEKAIRCLQELESIASMFGPRLRDVRRALVGASLSAAPERDSRTSDPSRT